MEKFAVASAVAVPLIVLVGAVPARYAFPVGIMCLGVINFILWG